MLEIKIDANNVIQGLDKVSNEVVSNFLTKAGLAVEALAKEKCYTMMANPTGALSQSINTIQDENSVSIGSGLDYALYVHEGTGIGAKGQTSRPKGTYWIYVKYLSSDAIASYKDSHSGQSKIYWSEAEAKRAVAYLKSKGLNAFYTNGQMPKPFLTSALQEVEPQFEAIFAQALKEAI